MTENHTNRQSVHARGGWSYEEIDTLFQEARLACENGKPIKSVFDKVAMLTGRKPNSIRNYYYLKLKENEDFGKTTFVPFEKDEVEDLIRAMLRGQAEGKSVRGIASEMGGGDKKKMLRYQNKYRSMLRNNPDQIRAIMGQMQGEGLPCADPFSCRRRQGRRAPKDVSEVISGLLGNLSKLGKDGEQILSGINNIFAAALEERGEVAADLQMASRLAELEQAKKALTYELSKVSAQNSELEKKLSTLAALNRGFVKMGGMERISGLTEYISAIERCIGSL